MTSIIQQLKKQLSSFSKDETAIDIYCDYVFKLINNVDYKTKKKKNPWAGFLAVDAWVVYFKKVAISGLFVDGENVTINNNGISLNYQAYKNLVLLRYPETIFDIQLVKDGDEFNFQKNNGKINYNHLIKNPFTDKKVIGGYAVIKNKAGEFLEILSLKDLEDIRKTAKTDYIWSQWLSEMYLKTIIKRACKRHFRDITEKIDLEDNNNYSLESSDIYINEDEQKEIEKLITEVKQDEAPFLEFCGASAIEFIPKSKYDLAFNLLNKKKKLQERTGVKNDNT